MDVEHSASFTDIVYHYPPELLQLLIDAIPLLCRSKQQLLTFFAGAGISKEILDDMTRRVIKDKDSISKYELTRVVLTRLNDRGESALKICP